MTRSFVRSLSVIAALGASATMAVAQSPRTPTVDLTPYVGYMAYGNLFDGPFGTSLKSANTAIYGAQLGLRVLPGVRIVGNVGYASSDLEAGVPFLGGFRVADASMLLYDGGIELGLPIAGSLPIQPFVGGGVGAAHVKVKNGMIETDATNLAWNFGGGVDVRLTPNFGLRLQAKDYVGKFDVRDATSLDIEANTAHNVALSVGVKMSF